MEYRRSEGFMPSSNTRLREPYEKIVDRREAGRQSLPRSASPHGLAPPEVGVDLRAGSSIEGRERDYGWHLDPGRTGTGRVRSRSPPSLALGEPRKRPHFDDGVGISPQNYSPTPSTELRLRRELGEPKNINLNEEDAGLRTMHAYGYEHSDPRISKEDFSDISLSAGEKHPVSNQKSVGVEDSVARGSYGSPSHLGPTSVYEDTAGGHLPSLSRNMDTQHFEHGRLQYQDPTVLNRLPVTQSYKDGEKSMYYLRDVSYHMQSGSNSKGLASSSTETSRNEFLAYRDSMHLSHVNEFKSPVKLTEPVSLNTYRERPLLDSARDPEGGQRNQTFYPRTYSPKRGEHENYMYSKSHEMVDRGYPGHDLHKMMVPRTQLDYGRTQIIYHHRDMPRPGITQPVVDRNDDIDGLGGNPKKEIMYYHPALEKQADPEYFDRNRTQHISKQEAEYLGSGFTHVELRRTVPQAHEISHLGAPKDHQISDLEANYGFGSDAGPQFQEGRLLYSPVSKYETEMNRQNARMQNVRDEHGIYKPQDTAFKGKYSIQEDASAYNSRTTLSGKMYSARQYDEDFYETGEEWIDEEMSGSCASRSTGYEHAGYRRAERKYDLQDDPDDFASEWVSSQELPHARKYPVGFSKHYGQHVKGRGRPGYIRHYNSQRYDRKDHPYRQQNHYDGRKHLYRQPNQYDRNRQHNQYDRSRQHNQYDRSRQHNQYDRKNHLYRQHKVWKRNEGYCEDLHEEDGNNDSDPSEDWVSPEECEPTEDTEEFKQLVHEAFLKYSKMVNANPAVQRRYKEEGKAGSFFCIVCGRSASKEFMDTQRLVTHAFMSHKAGLRAEHLGLHRAICVLLGWSTVVPDDTITWVPQVLPKAEALAQKEDLILWPPVIIIHNVSFSHSNPEKWKVVTMDALEAFIRGKGLIRGRIKVCLGKPADQSVMVVKFLGTFTGLGDAEKLHKYFSECKRGRLDLELAMSSNSEININRGAGKIEEQILYGYLGISEDLDRVDYITRNSGLIKSKKEIQDLANAPVKPEET